MKTVYSVTSSVKIKNATGTAQRSCSCGSWLKHWENFSNERPDECSVAGCYEEATVGAHITRPNAESEDYKRHPYIVPMCAKHNGKHGETFSSKNFCTFVWANVQQTCR